MGMVIISPLLLVAALQPSVIEGTVVEVRVHRHFAGKLGYRVSRDLVVEHDGQKVVVHLPPVHSRSRDLQPLPKVGDKYWVRS